MEITGKITIFPRRVENNGEVFVKCDGTLSTKTEKGQYVNKKVEVRFDKQQFPNDKLLALDCEKCYELQVEKGWLGVSAWKRKDGSEARDIYIHVAEGKLLSSKVVQRPAPVAEDGLPF